MKLSQIAKEVINEDSWGTNPSSGGSMSSGKTPNATKPAAAPTGGEKFIDVQKNYQSFETTIEKEEEAAKKKLETDLKQELFGKKIVARASKGSVGQTEKDYTINIADINVVYMSEKYYIVFKDTDKTEYYINTAFKVKVVGQAEKKGSQTPSPSSPTKGPVGGITYPQNMGINSKV